MTDEQEIALKGFEYAKALTELLISLSTGIVTLSITFSKDIFSTDTLKLKQSLVAVWIVYFLSILAGLSHQMFLTGALTDSPASIEIPNSARYAGMAQQIFFMGATLMIIRFGSKSLKKRA